MNDNTIIRIKVPARLYESVKAKLMIKENFEAPVEETEEVEETPISPVTPVVTNYATPAAKKKSSFNEDEFDALFTESKPKSPFKDEDEDNDLPF